MESQGNFVSEGRHDILVEAIRRPELRGRAVGLGIGIKLYFGVTQQYSSSSPQETKAEMTTKIREELMEEMRKKTDRMRLELRQEFLSQQVCDEPIQPLFSPTPNSTKGSCVTLTTSGKDIIV